MRTPSLAYSCSAWPVSPQAQCFFLGGVVGLFSPEQLPSLGQEAAAGSAEVGEGFLTSSGATARSQPAPAASFPIPSCSLFLRPAQS